MSELGDAARVAILLADYAQADAINKMNVIGAGWAVAGFDAATGTTAPQTVLVMVDVPPAHYGVEFTLGLQLRDSTGELVSIPGPMGQPQSLRIAQVARVEEPQFPPGANIPRNLVWAHWQLAVAFPNGLPLRGNEFYTWFVEIDSEERSTWATSFYLTGAPPGPVFG